MNAEEAAELREAMAAGRARLKWWDEHWDELVSRFPDQFVAVREGNVVGASSDLYGLLRQLERRYGEREPGWDIEFVTDDYGSIVL